MIARAIHFHNFKALRKTTLPLGRFTLIVGPNGSGKSTAVEALKFVSSPGGYKFNRIVTAGLKDSKSTVEVSIDWKRASSPEAKADIPYQPEVVSKAGWWRSGTSPQPFGPVHTKLLGGMDAQSIDLLTTILSGIRIFSFDPEAIAAPVQTHPNPELLPNGSNLAAVLDALTDSDPERFEDLNRELHRWLPEFDRVLFETPKPGMKRFLLRTSVGGHKYSASDLSHGTLFALAFLTLAHLPSPPPILCFEDPDRGIHPRLLREIRDGMYRLAFPENFEETRPPVQVIATTHSPYLLDLYKDHPEEIIIAHKDEQGVHFERLSEKPNIGEVLEGAPLGDVWYSGILGGVPSSP
jgi:predicted ATPase